MNVTIELVTRFPKGSCFDLLTICKYQRRYNILSVHDNQSAGDLKANPNFQKRHSSILNLKVQGNFEP